MRVRIKGKDGVWQPCLISDKNLYKLRAKHGEQNVIELEERERPLEGFA